MRLLLVNSLSDRNELCAKVRVGRRAVRGAEISRSEASGPLEARSNTVTFCSGIAGSLDMDVPPRKSSEVEAARNKTSFFGPPPLQGFLEDADALLGSSRPLEEQQ